MTTFTTIAQNDSTPIQRCKHKNVKGHDAYGDLAVGWCIDCGSIIIDKATANDPQALDGWNTYIIDPMSVCEMFHDKKPFYHVIRDTVSK